MRIYLTSVEESMKAKQIQHIVKSIFPNYSVKVILNKYATEKGKKEVTEYSKQYYEKNAEKIRRKRRERYQRQKAEKEMKIIEENLELTPKRHNKDYER